MSKKLSPEEDVRNFLQTLPINRRGTIYAYFKVIGSKEIVSGVGAGCHAAMKEPKGDILSLGTGILLKNKEQDEVFQKFYKWISSENSPWKVIFCYGAEVVRHPEDNLTIGIILPKETLEAVDFAFIKNFCILVRVFYEKWFHSNTWNILIEEYKMDPRDAYYLASTCWFPVDVVNSTFGTPSGLSGLHHPLTDNSSNYIDWNKYWTGDIQGRCGSQLYNSFWGPSNKEKFSYMPFSQEFERAPIPAIRKEGRFSTVSGYNANDMVERFYQWKKKYGLPEAV